MRSMILAGAAVALAVTAGAAAADTRICEATVRGPAGEHTVWLLMEDGAFAYGDALWAPPRQAARANIEFPRIELHYAVRDFDSGARSPLQYVMVTHAVRPTQTRARTAEVALGPYTGELEYQPWDFFAQVRDPANTGLRNSNAIAGEMVFRSPQALRNAQEAFQLETVVVTDAGERLAHGVFNLTTRPALDALMDRAFQAARRKADDPGRHCRLPRQQELEGGVRTR